MSSSSPPPPPAPDYTGAAQATAKGNLEAARATSQANRVNQYTPYGNIEYRQPDAQGNPDRWNMYQTLSPAAQKQFDQNQAINEQLGNIAQRGVGYVDKTLDTPMSLAGMYGGGGPADYSSAQSVGRPGKLQQMASDMAYQNATRYLDPQIQQQQSSLETQLANQGVQRGSEAYNNAMRDFQAQRNMQYDSARGQAYTQGMAGAQQTFAQQMQKRQQRVGELNTKFGQGQTARQQQIAEMQMLRQDPINMLNALRSGQQMDVTRMPGQMQVPGQQAVAGPDYLGGITAGGSFNQGIYNASQAAQANQNAGMYGAAATLGSAAVDRYSDRRLKENIKRVGTHILGIGLYTWDYIWGEPSSGVMADEVEAIMPEAISYDANGYKMVNYAMLGE
jgi:hypothetical protein